MINEIEVKENERLINIIEREKLKFIGHITRHPGLDNDLLTGMVYGKRSRGRQKTRITDTIRERLCIPISLAFKKAQNRSEWRKIIYDATAVRIRMN